ncbi:MAG TPA: hypothetical protein VKP78_12040 [bacterium]|nr:hypothetical protein [bacterium]
MKNNTALKIINPILGILILNQIFTGFFHDSISHKTFDIVHKGGGVLLAVGVVLHLILNRKWIKANFF